MLFYYFNETYFSEAHFSETYFNEAHFNEVIISTLFIYQKLYISKHPPPMNSLRIEFAGIYSVSMSLNISTNFSNL